VARQIKIDFLGDASDLNRATKQATGDLSGLGKHAGVVAGATAAVTSAAIHAVGSAARAVSGFLKTAIAEAEESAQKTKVTAALIKSTGGAAKVSAKQIGDYATNLSNITGIDDEVIQGAENVLLTFKNVRNETGKGNDIFKRATQAGADLSAVMGTDLQSAALQLGKALNDPTAGVTKLARSGVTFTQQQKDQIKVLQKSGDVLGAQKIILGEVESEFHGAAAANATATQKMSTGWKNFAEAIGTLILPAFNKVIDWLLQTVLPVVTVVSTKLIDWFGRLANAIENAFNAGRAGRIVGSFDSFTGAIARLANIAGSHFDPAMANLKQIGQWAKDNKTQLGKVALTAGGAAAGVGALGVAAKGSTAVSGLVSTLATVGTSLGPWGLVAVAVAAAGGAAVVAYQKWKPFHDLVDTTWQTILSVGQAVADWFMNTFGPVWAQVSTEVIGAGTAMGEFLAALFQRILQVVNIFITVFENAWGLWGDNILRQLRIVWALIRGVVEGALRIIQGVFQILTGILTLNWSKAWEGIKNIASGAASIIVAVFQAFLRALRNLMGGVADAILGPFRFMWSKLEPFLSGLAEKLLAPFHYFMDHIGGVFSGLAGIVHGVFDGIVGIIRGVINSLIDIVNSAIRAYNKIPLAPDIPTIGGVSALPPTNGAPASMSLAATRTPTVRGRAMTPAAAAVGGGAPIVINLPSGVNGHSVIDAVRRYERVNGRGGWRR
jgi:hypothetical protein